MQRFLMNWFGAGVGGGQGGGQADKVVDLRWQVNTTFLLVGAIAGPPGTGGLQGAGAIAEPPGTGGLQWASYLSQP